MVYLLAKCVYLLFFHPLSKYPGPRFAAISEVRTAHCVPVPTDVPGPGK